jgi:hypothetical protein
MELSHVHPALLVWAVVSVPASSLSILITYPNPIHTFHLFLTLMNVAGLIVLLSGLFHDVAEDSTDWNPDADPETITSWWLIGLVGVFLVSLLFGMFITGTLLGGIWVPQNLYPLTVTTPVFLYSFVTDLFGTWFSVVPGEESLKMSFAPINKAFDDLELPFAFQPASLMGSGVWAVEHVIKGQLPLAFAISVFVVSLVMDTATAQTGTPLTKWLIHASFNTILLTASFFIGGFLTIVPS